MVTRKLNASEKVFLFVITNAVLFGGIFASKLIGIPIETILLILITVVFIEIVYFVIFIQMSVNKNSRHLERSEQQICSIKEDLEKTHNLLIYMEHQLKTMQHDFGLLKKSSLLKTNGNGHLPKARA